ncbi:MAG: crotonase/enoyl-CoA hydratase family protein [Pseudomonadota bacterium]
MEPVTLTIENDIAHIHLDDGKANALGFAMIDALNAALDDAEANAKVVLFSGREGRYCAGFDLSVMREDPSKAPKLVNAGGHLLLRIFEGKLPSVIACTGHALAAGSLFLLAADTRIGVQGDFKIGLNETAIGMVLPTFGIELPRARLAQDHLTAATIQGHMYDPDHAVKAGFLDQAVPPGELMSVARSAAEALAQLPQSAYHGNKKLIRKPSIDIIRESLVPLD